MNKVNYINRKPRIGNYSIEFIFKTVSSNLSRHFIVNTSEVKKYGGSPFVLFVNLVFFKRQKGIYHITGDVHYMALRSGKKTVLTVHDVNSILKGNFFKKIYFKVIWFYLPALIVNKITVISEFSKSELCSIIPFAKNKISVIPNPISEIFNFHSLNFNSEKPNVLCVGTKDNKNLLRIFDAVASINCQVTIIGKLNADQLIKLESLKIEYICMSNLDDKQMIAAYIEADVLCFPSTYEGFGMPILEAQAMGRPVLTSNIGAMKEVASNSACLVNPYSVKSIKEGLEKIISDKEFRNNLIEEGLKNIQRFKLSKIVNQYESIYHSLSKN
ncbi:glycosyltransferase family 4 protein [Flavobacteriaceae bacterium 14752]|uniref:glycosyltransferase family 4 protein n=1 Tax=Mesohalobacter salilacus TaxID=2491711 RepID=UPI000F644EE0|nr:glycosyltransferase family 1 protein [Flavobacteriaceae bacterium 14752]